GRLGFLCPGSGNRNSIAHVYTMTDPKTGRNYHCGTFQTFATDMIWPTRKVPVRGVLSHEIVHLEVHRLHHSHAVPPRLPRVGGLRVDARFGAGADRCGCLRGANMALG